MVFLICGTNMSHRQYLFLYLDQSEINEIDILNIKGVHKEDDKFEAMVSLTRCGLLPNH